MDPTSDTNHDAVEVISFLAPATVASSKIQHAQNKGCHHSSNYTHQRKRIKRKRKVHRINRAVCDIGLSKIRDERGLCEYFYIHNARNRSTQYTYTHHHHIHAPLILGKVCHRPLLCLILCVALRRVFASCGRRGRRRLFDVLCRYRHMQVSAALAP
jgi:hypothetical protein